MGSSKRRVWETGVASWIANMLAVASASQKDNLRFFIWFSSFLYPEPPKGLWIDNVGSYISKKFIRAQAEREQFIPLTQVVTAVL
jgi:hypothetical protein